MRGHNAKTVLYNSRRTLDFNRRVRLVSGNILLILLLIDEDLMLKILSAIDSGERIPMEQIPDYYFKDGFEIVVEYKVQEDLIMHPDMARHLVFMDDGICYLIDDRVTNSAHGSAYRIMGENFYTLLDGLFQYAGTGEKSPRRHCFETGPCRRADAVPCVLLSASRPVCPRPVSSVRRMSPALSPR